jgi:hypothetical protein
LHHRTRHSHRSKQRGACQLIEGEHRRMLEPELVLQPRGRVAEAVGGAEGGRARIRIGGGGERHRARSPAAHEQADRCWYDPILIQQPGRRLVGECVRTLRDGDVHAIEAESFQHGRLALECAASGELANRARLGGVRVRDPADAVGVAALGAGRFGLHATLLAVDAQKGADRRSGRGSVALRRSASRTT